MLEITNTKRALLDHAILTIGMGSISREMRRPPHSIKYIYWLPANGLRMLLPQLKLVIKEQQRLLLLEALLLLKRNTRHDTSRDERLHQIYEEMRHLNKRGAT